MPPLLVVDPLALASPEGWTSRSCLERAFAGSGATLEFADAEDPELCEKALASGGVVLGGSERSAWTDGRFNDQLLDLIAICRNAAIPFLGICYGAQLLGRALGGHVARHPWGIELGAAEIELTDDGARHFLFEGLHGTSLRAVATHSDAVLIPPPGCSVLASSDHTRVQAFDFQGLLFGVQFHPEMDADDLRSLWSEFAARGIGAEILAARAQTLRDCRCGSWPRALENFARYAAAGVRIAGR